MTVCCQMLTPAHTQSIILERIDGDPSTMTVNDPIISEATFMNSTGFSSNQSAANTNLNINGPSVIRVPDWIPEFAKTHPDANYYMYFAHHQGRSIRMAWANTIQGPWHIFNMGFAPDKSWGYGGNYSGLLTIGNGVLDIELGSTTGTIEIDNNYIIGDHIASPDVVVDNVNERIIMYFHGFSLNTTSGQQTFVASSKYGLNFNILSDGGEVGQGIRAVVPGHFYFRTFQVEGEVNGQNVLQSFAYANRGLLYKAPTLTFGDVPANLANGDDLGGLWNPTTATITPWWTLIPDTDNPLFQVQASLAVRPNGNESRRIDNSNSNSPRHFAVYHDPVGDRNKIYILYTGRGDAPESVVLVMCDLTGLSEEERLDPSKWRRTLAMEEFILEPEENWEGADLAIEYSSGGLAVNKRQLRDPYLFKDADGQLYLFYTGRGEEAIGVAKLTLTETIRVSPKVLLGGAYENSTASMADALRTNNLLPSVEPYSALGYSNIQNTGVKVPSSMFSLTGDNAVVDWVLVDLLDATHSLVARRVGLLQHDGDVVEVTGVPMSFINVLAGNYHVALRHRNHLGVMTQQTYMID
ncbi:MAG: hypothetical protein AAF738_05245 [Bacteroidota bacterium]